MKETFLSPSDTFAPTPIDSLAINKCNSGDTTIISDLTENGPKMMSDRIMSLNYSSGNSAMVLETLVAAQDVHETRERNRMNKDSKN